MESQSSGVKSFSGVSSMFLVMTEGVILPCGFNKPRDCSNCRSASMRPLATVGTGLPFTSAVSRGASRIVCSCVNRARKGALPAAT